MLIDMTLHTEKCIFYKKYVPPKKDSYNRNNNNTPNPVDPAYSKSCVIIIACFLFDEYHLQHR